MRICCILFVLIAAYNLNAEKNIHTVASFITDKITGKPLPNVSIFVSGTSSGLVSDRIGYFEIKNLPKGNYKLTFSLIGYESSSFLLELNGSEMAHLEVKLTPRIYSTETIEVKAKRTVDESKIFELFKKLFFGISDFADSCSILNERAIKICGISEHSYRINCDSAIIIRNSALGYIIRGNINQSSIDISTSELKINFKPIYEEINPRDAAQNLFWLENRNAAFKGTLRHFLLSLYHNRLYEDGYQLYIKRQLKNNQLEKLEDIYRLISADNDGRMILKTEDILVIKYGLDISAIQLRTPSVIINNTGQISEKSAVAVTGVFAERNLSKQLPDNYLPQTKKKFQQKNIHDQTESFLDSINHLNIRSYEYIKDSVKLLSFKQPDDAVLQLKYAVLLERCCITSAENILSEIIEKDTLCSEAYYRLGLMKAKEYNDYKGSIKEIIDEYEQETIRTRMAMNGEHLNIPNKEKHVFKFADYNEETFEESALLLAKAISCNPEIDDYYLILANLYEDAGKYNSAIEVIRKLLGRNIDNKSAHLLSGLLNF